jgi:propane 2-monooxygenase small subunit
MSVGAARALQPIWSQPGEKVIRFEQSLEHARRRFAEIVGSLNLNATEVNV